MKNIDLKQNFARIIRVLEVEKGMKPTKIAHEIGYTTTRQLYNSIDGSSLLSTKAIMGLIENLNINPQYLFLREGNIFLSDETELDKLRQENFKLEQDKNEILKKFLSLVEENKRLQKRNDDLIEISSAAIKYHTIQKEESQSEHIEPETKK